MLMRIHSVYNRDSTIYFNAQLSQLAGISQLVPSSLGGYWAYFKQGPNIFVFSGVEWAECAEWRSKIKIIHGV